MTPRARSLPAIGYWKAWTVLCLAVLFGADVAAADSSPFSSIVGVNFSRQYASNPNPLPLAHAMQQIKQSFNMVKLFKFEADVVQAAVANGLEIALGTLNGQLAEFAAGTPSACSACDTYAATIAPYKNNIKAIILANEPFTTPGVDPAQLVPAMRNLSAAFKRMNPPLDIPITTVLAFSTLAVSYPPDAGAFRPDIVANMSALLAYLGEAGSANFIFLNVYPYFAIRDNPNDIRLGYALFKQPVGGFANLFVAQYTAFRAAMGRLTPPATIPVLIGETGWASAGSSVTIGPSDSPVPPCTDRLIAAACNEGVYVKGFIDWAKAQTPPLTSFLFEMYDEALKPGSTDEPHFGLFTESGARKFSNGLLMAGRSPFDARTKASTLLEFDGKADQVGKKGDRGKVQIEGTFTFNGTLDLRHAQVRLDRVLRQDDVIVDDEIVGGGDLVEDGKGTSWLPLVLKARPGGDKEAAQFEAQDHRGPKVHMDIGTHHPGSDEYAFSARLEHLGLPESADACKAGNDTVALTTSFTVDDGKESVLVSTRTDWDCRKNQLRAP